MHAIAGSPTQPKRIATHSPTAAPAASSRATATAASIAHPFAPVAPPVQSVQLQFKSVAQRRKEKQLTATIASSRPVQPPTADESTAEMSDEAEAAGSEQSAGLESDEDQPWIVLHDTDHPYTAEEAEILRHSRRLPLSRIRMPGGRAQPAAAAAAARPKQMPAPQPPSPPPRTRKTQTGIPRPSKQSKRKRVVVVESSSSSEGAVSSDADSSSEDSTDYSHLPPRHMLTRPQRKDAGELISDAETLPEWNARGHSTTVSCSGEDYEPIDTEFASSSADLSVKPLTLSAAAPSPPPPTPSKATHAINDFESVIREQCNRAVATAIVPGRPPVGKGVANIRRVSRCSRSTSALSAKAAATTAASRSTETQHALTCTHTETTWCCFSSTTRWLISNPCSRRTAHTQHRRRRSWEQQKQRAARASNPARVAIRSSVASATSAKMGASPISAASSF